MPGAYDVAGNVADTLPSTKSVMRWAGALAKLVLRKLGVSITAYTSQVGDIALDRDYRKYDLSLTESNIVRCPDADTATKMEHLISEVKKAGDTIGGIITCVVKGCPVGIGEPEFGKLDRKSVV